MKTREGSGGLYAKHPSTKASKHNDRSPLAADYDHQTLLHCLPCLTILFPVHKTKAMGQQQKATGVTVQWLWTVATWVWPGSILLYDWLKTIYTG